MLPSGTVLHGNVSNSIINRPPVGYLQEILAYSRVGDFEYVLSSSTLEKMILHCGLFLDCAHKVNDTKNNGPLVAGQVRWNILYQSL